MNTKSGVILVGYDDKGNLKGLDNPEELEEKISNGLKTNISPDARMFVSINVEEKGDKKFLSIKVSKGIELNPKSWTVYY
ncbi:MAG: putative DNA binding domain-containing protein [Clostridia bacterium]|nr:putative DNA binding domain-containing protein [Clostridia bacterium]